MGGNRNSGFRRVAPSGRAIARDPSPEGEGAAQKEEHDHTLQESTRWKHAAASARSKYYPSPTPYAVGHYGEEVPYAAITCSLSTALQLVRSLIPLQKVG